LSFVVCLLSFDAFLQMLFEWCACICLNLWFDNWLFVERLPVNKKALLKCCLFQITDPNFFSPPGSL
jgi:hypothetical protein